MSLAALIVNEEHHFDFRAVREAFRYWRTTRSEKHTPDYVAGLHYPFLKLPMIYNQVAPIFDEGPRHLILHFSIADFCGIAEPVKIEIVPKKL